jgi:hypothetical protein
MLYMPGQAAAWTTANHVTRTSRSLTTANTYTTMTNAAAYRKSSRSTSSSSSSGQRRLPLLSFSKASDPEGDWDDDVDYEKEFPTAGDADVSPDPTLSWNTPAADDDIMSPKLGIDIGKMLAPLSDKDAAELKAAATEVINDAIADGIDDIEILRARMKLELEQTRANMAVESEKNTQRESDKLLNKIDALTDAFLSSTAQTRSSTKLAAEADKSMKGKGVEMGTWGDLGDGTAVVTTMSSSGQSVLLGSVQAAQSSSASSSEVSNNNSKLSVLVVADIQQDPVAKLLLPVLTERLESALPGLKVCVYKPTATLPIGGDDASCVVLFCTSLSDKSSVSSIMDRVLRKTMKPDGGVGIPPSQIVGISTIGTERTNKMPYTMQNMLGGKLERRRQIEEAIMNTIKQRTALPACDYTICKFGELKETLAATDEFDMAAGDVFDGSTQIKTAATILVEAIAFQPAARNTTLSCIGSLPADDGVDTAVREKLLEDAFLRLDGPELARIALGSDAQANYLQLVEYLREWAMMLQGGKGLTTPIRAEVPIQKMAMAPGVKESASVQLNFLPTATGKNYLSREEEKELEKKKGTAASEQTLPFSSNRSTARDGGIEIIAEITTTGQLRVRAKRCNYADDIIVKELSEQTILSRFRKCIDVWKKDHQVP